MCRFMGEPQQQGLSSGAIGRKGNGRGPQVAIDSACVEEGGEDRGGGGKRDSARSGRLTPN